MLNGKNHKKTSKIALEHKALSFPFPEPVKSPTEVESKSEMQVVYGH
jgi:hypothetical protein